MLCKICPGLAVLVGLLLVTLVHYHHYDVYPITDNEFECVQIAFSKARRYNNVSLSLEYGFEPRPLFLSDI